MEIAVAGCGITGTAVAYFLAQAGHHVTIFEQAPKCGPVGAGIMLQPSGQRVLQEMGLLDQVEGCSARLDGMTAKLVSGKHLVRLHYEDLETGLHGIGAHRGRLFQLLYDTCQQVGVTIRTGNRICGYQLLRPFASSKVCVLLESDNGKQPFGEFDFVIGADGSLSALRYDLKPFSKHTSKTIEYDHAALWMTTETEYRSEQLVQIVDGTQKLVGLLPIGQNECSFFWGLKADEFDWLSNSDFDEWKQEVIKTCPEAELLLHNKSSFDDFTFARYRHVKVKRFFSDYAILLGDAAHATSPHLGQGANLGLEDAMMFANALSDANNHFNSACQLFAKRRTRQIRYYQSLTRILTPFFQSDGSWRAMARNIFLPLIPKIPYLRKQMLRTLCGFKKGWFG